MSTCWIKLRRCVGGEARRRSLICVRQMLARRCGMWARKIAFVGLALVVVVAWADARSTHMVGAVASVTPNSLDVVTKSEGTKSVSLDGSTQYLKWITHKPWQGSQQADFA